MTLFGALDSVDKLPEKEWQRIVVDALDTFRWVGNHVYRGAMKDGSYRTTTTAVGWPDLMYVRGEYLLAIECKGYDTRGRPTKVTPQQIEWLERLALIPTARCWILRPSDNLRTIVGWLRDPANAPRRHGWGEWTTVAQ